MFAGDPPVAVASHLFYYLAVDLVLQGVVLGGRAEDLVGQLDRMASVLGGVVTHIPQDGWQEKRLRSKIHSDKKNWKSSERSDVRWWISF